MNDTLTLGWTLPLTWEETNNRNHRHVTVKDGRGYIVLRGVSKREVATVCHVLTRFIEERASMGSSDGTTCPLCGFHWTVRFDLTEHMERFCSKRDSTGRTLTPDEIEATWPKQYVDRGRDDEESKGG